MTWTQRKKKRYFLLDMLTAGTVDLTPGEHCRGRGYVVRTLQWAKVSVNSGSWLSKI